MKRSTCAKLAAVTLAALMLLCACSTPAASSPSPEAASTPQVSSSAKASSVEAVSAAPEHDPVTLSLAAAASLETVFTEQLIPLFTAQNPWVTVEGTYDSSGKLQTQIEEGLAADVFFSAAKKQMNALVEEELVDPDSVVELLENQIVLIVPAGSDAGLTSFEDIANAGTVAIGDPESVPAGQYGKEALESLGLWDAVSAKASLGTNVTEVLNWVAEGSADAGIVYATDAAQMPDKVEVVATAPEGSLAAKVIYPVGILAASEQRETADAFLAFLQSQEAQDIFTEAGFVINS